MGNRESRLMAWDETHPLVEKLVQNVEQVIIGKRDVVELCLVALLAGGHILLEDVPGVGKTMLVKALARSLGMKFSRIQFTPDLLPTDVTGVSVFNQKTLEFEFRPGPLMANIVLADEINRTPPRTQAALLEAMEEGNVTVDGKTYELEKPFFVMATQNPIEYEGTFPLPEAQLDRFLLKLSIGYPAPVEEVRMLKHFRRGHAIGEIGQVWSREELFALQKEVMNVHVSDAVTRYIVEIVDQTRRAPECLLGASPRASIALYRASQAWALLRGRSYVIPDDVKRLVLPVLSHRLLLSPSARLEGKSTESVLESIMRKISVPVVPENG
jgi:MoxR-like ATPase